MTYKTNVAIIVLFFSVLAMSQSSIMPNTVLAGTINNYSDTANITTQNWANLVLDFLIKRGDTWSGPGGLNMGTRRITGLPLAATSTNAAISKRQVDDLVNGIGGNIDVNWGREDCPVGSLVLYSGIGFSEPYSSHSGGPNTICLRSGDPGPAFSGGLADKIYPMNTTATAGILPPDGSIPTNRAVKCAVCYKANSTCLDVVGTWNCPAGFNTTEGYTGYVLGSQNDPHYNALGRECVNRNFDGAISIITNGARYYGARVDNTLGLTAYGSAQDSFVKCAKCCN